MDGSMCFCLTADLVVTEIFVSSMLSVTEHTHQDFLKTNQNQKPTRS